MSTEPSSSPQSQQLNQWCEQAVALARAGEVLRAEQQLRLLLRDYPAHSPAAFFLADLLCEQGRFNAAANVVRHLATQVPAEADVTSQSARFLEQVGHTTAALAVLERALPEIQPRALPPLRFHAGRLALALGKFSQAREFFLAAMNGASAEVQRHAMHALSTTLRYTDSAHPDFALFRERATDVSATDEARASALFALGKACDDIDDTHAAADAWRQANALVDRHSAWSPKPWRRFVTARVQSTPPPTLTVQYAFTPVFIVGLPRTGTTLVAEILSRHPEVTARGELTWIEHFAGQLAQSGQMTNPSTLHSAASLYAMQLVRDDPPTRWYVDKQPLNFRYLDLITALFPQARIIHCVRDERDTALSIWSQYFAGKDGGFAYDFAHIAEMMRGSQKLMAHWNTVLPASIHTLHYEDLAERPEQTVQSLHKFLDLPSFDLIGARAKDGAAINTASVWQARQPIYTRAIGRWRAYAAHITELEQLFRSSAAMHADR